MRTCACILLILFNPFQRTQSQYAQLWTTATAGGAVGFGTILESDTNGFNFHTVHSFNDTDGYYPEGRLVLADNGFIYGQTRRGGVGGSCVLFKIDTSTYDFTKIYDFEANPQYGAIPYEGMIKFTDGKLYGTTNVGGANNIGVIYSLDPATDTYSDIFDFTDSTGSSPLAGFMIYNGMLCGTTSKGGINGTGVIYSFNPVNDNYNVIYNFGDTSGYCGWGRIIKASDGKFYGTIGGSLEADGIAYSFDPTNGNYQNLHKFDFTYEGSPMGGFYEYANNKLYMMTSIIGSNLDVYGLDGGIYSYNLATDSFMLEKEFDSITGYSPERTFTKISTGELLATTMQGGTNGLGVIFSYIPETNTINTLLNLDGISAGEQASSDILETGASVATKVNEIPNHVSTLIIYPNPASKNVTVEVPNNNEFLVLSDTQGNILANYVTIGRKLTIDISSFPDGLYFINKTMFAKQ